MGCWTVQTLKYRDDVVSEVGKESPTIAVLLCFVLCFVVDTYTSGVLFGVPCKILFQCVHFTVCLCLKWCGWLSCEVVS